MRESGEDYLETIYLLAKRNPNVHAVDIANEFSYSKPSVTRAVKILKENDYITVDSANCIRLTETGRKKAEEIYERHRIITKFLILSGVSAETAAKDACRMEHDISEEAFLCFKNTVTKNQTED